MSATLGALVIAISTEFSVLLSERFRQERAAGYELAEALARTYRSTGAAVLASGITAIAGFGVLIFSSITMLRDFGFVTLIDLTVSLAGVLLVLPAVLALSERDGLLAGGARVGAQRRRVGCRGRAAGAPGSRERSRRTGSGGPAAPPATRTGPRHPRRPDPPRRPRARGAPAPPPQPVDTRGATGRMIAIFGLGAGRRVLGLAVRLPRRRRQPGSPPASGCTTSPRRSPPRRSTATPTCTPPCTLARHDPRALNICLLAERGPLVLAFFVTGSSACERQVDTLQAVSRQFARAAGAVRRGRGRREPLADRREACARTTGRSRSPTTPTARSAALYGVAVCPMVELAKRGGIVAQRLIGEHWLAPAALAAAGAQRCVAG